jgi:hypothetical protein
MIARITQAAHYVISGNAPDAWFGPNQPVQPMAPEDVAGRRFDYPTGYNLNYTPRSSEPLSFADLRALADNCDILRSVIETRKDQMEALHWSVRVKPSLHVKNPTTDQQNRIIAITAFLQSPDRENSFGGWLRQILEDMFVIDAACIYRRRTQGGELHALEIIDGATIKILMDESGRLPLSPDAAYQQVLKGVPAVNYTRDELLYMKHNPRSHKVYGYSHVEQVMVTVNILIRRALHQLEYYREGSQPDAFIGLPKEWNQDQIAQFQKHFDAMLAGNLALRRRLRFMPGEFKYQETKAPPLKDAYDEFLARIICYVFSVSPEPFVSHVNRATAESSQKRATEEGLAPLQHYVCELINRILRDDFASPDLEFIWQDMRGQDPKDAADIDVAYIGAGVLTVDEVRAKLGLQPLARVHVSKGGDLCSYPYKEKTKKFNQYHVPAGVPEGGQFTTADGAGNTDYPDDRVESSYPVESAIAAFGGGEIVQGIRGALAIEAEISNIITRAIQTSGNDGITVSSKSVAETSAERFVGENSGPMYDRNTKIQKNILEKAVLMAQKEQDIQVQTN